MHGSSEKGIDVTKTSLKTKFNAADILLSASGATMTQINVLGLHMGIYQFFCNYMLRSHCLKYSCVCISGMHTNAKLCNLGSYIIKFQMKHSASINSVKVISPHSVRLYLLSRSMNTYYCFQTPRRAFSGVALCINAT